jgi:hypothetical protein
MNMQVVSSASYPLMQHDGACASLVGKELVGKKGVSWRVIQQIQPKHYSTGGTFSIGYPSMKTIW